MYISVLVSVCNADIQICVTPFAPVMVEMLKCGVFLSPNVTCLLQFNKYKFCFNFQLYISNYFLLYLLIRHKPLNIIYSYAAQHIYHFQIGLLAETIRK